MKRRKNFQLGVLQLKRADPAPTKYVSASIAARVLYLSKVQVLRYFAGGELKGFRVGPDRNAAVKIARSSIIEFAEKYQKRTIKQDEIDQCAKG
ncbi:MAG: hypothetical protein FJ009_06080 [Chloroflexi bacterium]|nr:hypothetical protein [Chloroflexota bacterium]